MNKDLLEENEKKKAECKFLETEIEIAELKKKIKNENDKFEFNLIKLNLLNIVDKLKLQVDREKSKYERFKERVTS